MTENELWERYRVDKDVRIRNRIAEKYYPLCKNIASRIYKSKQYYDYDDITQNAVYGLLEAIDRFDYTRSIKFTSYAYKLIYGAAIDGIRKEDFIPNSIRKDIKYFMRLWKSLNRLPKRKDIKNWTAMRYKKVYTIIHSTTFKYIDEDYYQIADDRYDPFEITKTKIDFEKLGQNMKLLSKKEQAILKLIYYEKLSLKEVSDIYNLTGSRISQIKLEALQKLKNNIIGVKK
jgi:RNA polymerase sigma factor for flagellar operon FliA